MYWENLNDKMHTCRSRKFQQKITNAAEDVEKEEGSLIHCWWECKLVWPLWK
jgi:hypothetical protein